MNRRREDNQESRVSDIQHIDASPDDVARSLVRSANKKRDKKLRENKRGDRRRRLGGR